jgi:APA family basic amino acid/polyamine antiporter
MVRSATLQRMLGAPTALFVGLGVAIGSGIFRVPGEVARHLPAIEWIILAWVLGGVVNLMQGLVTAELATRHPRAGGEYVYLREAYGEFAAFFFGWAFTIFVVGGGAASIAAAGGDFAVALWRLDESWSGYAAAAAIILVTAVNAIGLRVSATVQNVLAIVKILALILVIIAGLGWGRQPLLGEAANASAGGLPSLSMMLAGFMAAFWPYLGTTDAAMLAEEVKDVRRAIPRALILSSLLLTALYVLFNIALLRVVPAGEMGAIDSVPGVAMGRVLGEPGRVAMLVVAILICLSTLSSTVLATIRVTFALARDGLAFRFLARMSRRQAPVAALLVVGAASVALVLTRSFEEILRIYFLAAAILFGLTYGSLIVFRLREAKVPREIFRCPFGYALATMLIVLEVALGVNVIVTSPKDAGRTLGFLAALGIAYVAWKWWHRRDRANSEAGLR